MPDIALGRKPDGTTDEVRLDDDGALKVAAEVAAPGGVALATEATAERTADAAEALAGTVGAGQPTAEDDAVAVALKPGQEVITTPGATFANAAAAQDAPDLGATYVAGDVSVTSPDLAAIRSNTDELEEDAERAADATESTAAKLGILAAQEATTAKDTSVDQVEPKLEDVKTKLDTANAALDGVEALLAAGNASTASIDAKTLAPLGTDFATPVRGTATVTAAQLPNSSTPRGFTLENIDSANDLWVGTDNTVTTANGFRISPSRARFFDLGNPNTLWVISASTTAWQIGAVS